MKMQVLVAALEQKNVSKLVKNMNIRTDAIIANQCDKNEYEEIIQGYNKIKVYNFNERGVGLNRNNALMRANADIVLMADDDIEYVDDYEKIIIQEFENNPKADMIVFNLEKKNKEKERIYIKKSKRIHMYNCLRYGTARYAFRLNKIREKNIYFSLLFGGGAKYSCGEDSIFILEALKKGLRVFVSNKNIGYICERKSTCFNGYNEKFFFDRGVLFKCLFGKLAGIMSIQFLVRHRKILNDEIGMKDALKYMLKGTKEL